MRAAVVRDEHQRTCGRDLMRQNPILNSRRGWPCRPTTVSMPGLLLAMAILPAGPSGCCDDAAGWIRAKAMAPARTPKARRQRIAKRMGMINSGWRVTLAANRDSPIQRNCVNTSTLSADAVALSSRPESADGPTCIFATSVRRHSCLEPLLRTSRRLALIGDNLVAHLPAGSFPRQGHRVVDAPLRDHGSVGQPLAASTAQKPASRRRRVGETKLGNRCLLGHIGPDKAPIRVPTSVGKNFSMLARPTNRRPNALIHTASSAKGSARKAGAESSAALDAL